MDYIFFVLYLILFAWLVTKTKFFLASGLSKPQLVILLLLKVIAGIFYGWIGLYYGGLAQMLDTWSYHHSGIMEYQILQDKPSEYFTNLFNNPYEHGVANFFGSNLSYWNDLKGNIFIKLLSVFDIFTSGRYYVNVIFYSYLTMFGPIAVYRVMNDAFPTRKIPVVLATFLVPSFLYWTSGIHREGLIFVGISLIIYHLYFAAKEKQYKPKRIAGLLLGLFLLLILRNFMLIIFVPAMLAWFLAQRWPQKALACFVGVYIFFGILFFTLRYIDPRLDFPKAVSEKQEAFRQVMIGNSTIPIKQLKPTLVSFIKNTPQALTLSIIRPYPSDIKNLLSLIAALEIFLLLILFIMSLLWKEKTVHLSTSLVYFCLFFSFSILLSIGFSVNNLGAIVRYRSVVLPMFVILIAVRMDWTKVAGFFSKNISFRNNINKPR